MTVTAIDSPPILQLAQAQTRPAQPRRTTPATPVPAPAPAVSAARDASVTGDQLRRVEATNFQAVERMARLSRDPNTDVSQYYLPEGVAYDDLRFEDLIGIDNLRLGRLQLALGLDQPNVTRVIPQAMLAQGITPERLAYAVSLEIGRRAYLGTDQDRVDLHGSLNPTMASAYSRSDFATVYNPATERAAVVTVPITARPLDITSDVARGEPRRVEMTLENAISYDFAVAVAQSPGTNIAYRLDPPLAERFLPSNGDPARRPRGQMITDSEAYLRGFQLGLDPDFFPNTTTGIAITAFLPADTVQGQARMNEVRSQIFNPNATDVESRDALVLGFFDARMALRGNNPTNPPDFNRLNQSLSPRRDMPLRAVPPENPSQLPPRGLPRETVAARQ